MQGIHTIFPVFQIQTEPVMFCPLLVISVTTQTVFHILYTVTMTLAGFAYIHQLYNINKGNLFYVQNYCFQVIDFSVSHLVI